MRKREFYSSDIDFLSRRVNLAIRTVQIGSDMDNNMQRAIIESVGLLSEKEGMEILKNIPVEEINADKSGIRTGLLKEHGIETISDVLCNDVYHIASIYGIGQNMAVKVKNIAQKIAGDIKKNVKIRLSSDNRSPEYTRLVMNVSQYLRAGNCLEKCRRLAFMIPGDAASELKKIKRASNAVSWFFTTDLKKQEAIESYNRLFNCMNQVDAEPLYNEITLLQNVTADEAWDDFSVDSVSFFYVLENLVPEHFSSDSDGYGLSTEIKEDVEKTELDLTGFNCKLRGYQVWGVKYILRQRRVLLGDEMGLGKTVQALASMVHLRNQGDRHFLVICPASVIINWCREIESKSDLTAVKIHSTGKDIALRYWKENGGVAVTNYETLAGTFLLEKGFWISMVVVDEAHYVKNALAKRSRNVKDVCAHSGRILFMTGTPIENNVEEMINLLDYLQPEVAQKAKEVSMTAYADHFKEVISPVYYRRKREDVLSELPELIQIQEWCDMTPEDEEQYIRDMIGGNFMEVRRLSWRNQDYVNTSSKVQRLREIVEEARDDGRKIIVFSVFLDTLEKIKEIFGSGCVGVINGSVPPQSRQEIIDRFDLAPEGSVLAAQIQSGGTGLNIQAASVVVICEPQYKPSAEMQAISRAYRMGQTRNVFVHRLLCANTVEERIMKILWEKQEEFNRFADESNAAKKDMEIDSMTINSIMEEEIRRIREKYTEDQIKMLTG